MSETQDFRQYAAEAIQSSLTAKTDEEKMAFLDLAKVWSRAAERAQEIFSGRK
jgi:hypothetical protein